MSGDPVSSLFISWVPHHRRSEDLARLLGADAVWIARGTPRRRWSAPLRWALQALETIRVLRDRRPALVYVMAPPALAVVCVRLALGSRPTVVVDAHGKAVRRIGSDRVRASFRVLGRLSDAVLVTNRREAARVQGRCRSVLVIQDPLGDPEPGPGPNASQRPLVVFPAGWEADEPIDAVIAAARMSPDTDWVITGTPPAKPPPCPENLRLSGRIPDDDYFDLLGRASAVLALTTRTDTMQRAGYDAALVGVGLVASDTEALREYFEDAAVYSGSSADDLAAAVSDALERREELRSAMLALADRRRAEQSDAIDELRAEIDGHLRTR